MDRPSRIASFVIFGALAVGGAWFALTNLPSTFPFRTLGEAVPVVIGVVVAVVGLLGVLGAVIGDSEAARDVGPDLEP